MKYFTGCDSIETAKALYRKLALANHPDQGGDAEVFKAIADEFEAFLHSFMGSSFEAFKQSRTNYSYSAADVDRFADILSQIIDWNITIEVIGYWIYATESYEYKDQLKSLGFWFSGKHKAWIFSGGTKEKKRRTYLSKDAIREIHGSEKIRERSAQIALPA